jgi:hypothetical protein
MVRQSLVMAILALSAPNIAQAQAPARSNLGTATQAQAPERSSLGTALHDNIEKMDKLLKILREKDVITEAQYNELKPKRIIPMDELTNRDAPEAPPATKAQ